MTGVRWVAWVACLSFGLGKFKFTRYGGKQCHPSLPSHPEGAGETAQCLSAGAPGSWPVRAVALLECLEWPPADYQSESIGNAPMKQCVTAKFANDSHSGRAARSAVSYLPGAA